MNECNNAYEDFDHSHNISSNLENFTKLQLQDIYERNNPEKLPELRPLATGKDARGHLRSCDDLGPDNTSMDQAKRQR